MRQTNLPGQFIPHVYRIKNRFSTFLLGILFLFTYSVDKKIRIQWKLHYLPDYYQMILLLRWAVRINPQIKKLQIILYECLRPTGVTHMGYLELQIKQPCLVFIDRHHTSLFFSDDPNQDTMAWRHIHCSYVWKPLAIKWIITIRTIITYYYTLNT